MKEARKSLARERARFQAWAASRETPERGAAPGRRVAVVLSGGGARGAYEAGVLLAFQDGRVPTHIITATSIGSINAASYAANSETLVGNAEPLVQAWFELTSPAIGIEWTRYIFILAGLVAGVIGFGNLIRERLNERGVIFVHLHDPKLTWLFLGLAGISVLLFYDRLSYLGHAARNLLRRRPWKPQKMKLVLSLLANAMVSGLIFMVVNPAHFHLRLTDAVRRRPATAAAAFAALVSVLISRRFLRGWVSRLSHEFLRLPFRTGLFPNFERMRFLRERIAADRLRASPIRVVVAATELEEGIGRFFSNASRDALAADAGADPAFVATEMEPEEDLMRALLASSALPILYETVRLGGKAYTDGSLVSAQPIRPAIRLGADVIFLVMTQPAGQKGAEIKTFLDMGLRALDIVMAQNLRKDLKILDEMNRLCGKHAVELGVRPEQVNVVMGARACRYLQVFTVCPELPLAATLLDFEGGTSGQAVLRGYLDGCKAVSDFRAYSAQAASPAAKYTVGLALVESDERTLRRRTT